MNTPVKSVIIGDCEVCVYIDENPINPRENDNLGEILYTGNRYILGDRKASPSEIALKEENRENVILPVYAYIHSGIALNTTGFSCCWDSGQSGIIYTTKEKIRKFFGVKRITKKTLEKVENCLRVEIEEFSSYLNGDVYGFVIKKRNGEIVESCWGFYDIDDCLNEGKSCINFAA